MQNPSPSTGRTDGRKLPIGIQTFRKMREENCYYVDKTAHIHLRARHYADKYRARGEPIHLIAVEFSRESRNIAAFEIAHIDP